MDKTIDSSIVDLEGEITRWSGFARALRKPDREAFDGLMDICRGYASEGSNAANPDVFELMVMPILIFQQKRISKLEAKLQEIKPDTTSPPESQEHNSAAEAKAETSVQTAPSGGGQSRLF
jgi:hypothetical protein